MRTRLLALILLFLLVAPLAIPVTAAVPAGFSDTLVTSVAQPTALTFTPDGRMLVTTQPGALRVIKNGVLVATPALTLGARVCSNFERGLLGVALDPQFAENGFIYLFYSYNKHDACPQFEPTNADNPVNRVSRFTMSGDTVTAGSERVLVDNLTSRNGNHNAGDLFVGKDGFLYISIGDGGVSNDATHDELLAGKILRVDRSDGSPAAGNPWLARPGARRCGDPAGVPGGNGPCAETFASGLRNPFRMAVDEDAAGTRFFINDVGDGTWEEVNLGAAGAHYGWPEREGPCQRGVRCVPPFDAPPTGRSNPLYAYHRQTDNPSCRSITGGAVVPQAAGWPAGFPGMYLYGDYVCGKIVRLSPGSFDGFDLTPTDFATSLGGSSAVHMRFGPSARGQSLYYTTYAGGGQVRRIDSTASTNRPPSAVIAANPRFGATDTLAVNFDGSASTDPDGDALTYTWDFGDGASGSGATTNHTYATRGTYSPTLVVRDARGGVSSPATVRIDVGNTPPVPIIDAPTEGALFSVGEALTLRGSVTDAQDAQPPTLRWDVFLHHDTHTHPLQSGTGTQLSLAGPPPEDLAAAENSYLEVRLTATDSSGLSATITRDLRPRTVAVTFASAPSGMRLLVNGRVLVMPATITSWQGWGLSATGIVGAGPGGEWYELRSWQHGGAAAQTIITPGTPTTYTAVFEPADVWLLPVVMR